MPCFLIVVKEKPPKGWNRQDARDAKTCFVANIRNTKIGRGLTRKARGKGGYTLTANQPAFANAMARQALIGADTVGEGRAAFSRWRGIRRARESGARRAENSDQRADTGGRKEDGERLKPQIRRQESRTRTFARHCELQRGKKDREHSTFHAQPVANSKCRLAC